MEVHKTEPLLISSSLDSTIRLWRLDTFQLVRKVKANVTFCVHPIYLLNFCETKSSCPKASIQKDHTRKNMVLFLHPWGRGTWAVCLLLEGFLVYRNFKWFQCLNFEFQHQRVDIGEPVKRMWMFNKDVAYQTATDIKIAHINVVIILNNFSSNFTK